MQYVHQFECSLSILNTCIYFLNIHDIFANSLGLSDKSGFWTYTLLLVYMVYDCYILVHVHVAGKDPTPSSNILVSKRQLKELL